LLLAGIGVLLVLPRYVTDTPPAPLPVKTAESQPPANDAPDLSAARQQAEQTLQQFLQQQAALQRDHADVWASTEWNTVLGQAQAGDRQFGAGHFEQAAQQYAGALAGLQALQAGRAARLDKTLAAGWQALENNQAGVAVKAFQQVLVMEADHAGAQRGLVRARVRPQVLKKVAEGAAAAQAGDWTTARTVYQTAVDLDSGYAPAVSGFEDARRQVRLQTFNQAMDTALTVLHHGRLSAAERALKQSASVNPEATVLQDARRRLGVARQQAALTGLRRMAAIAVRSEDWQKARRLYQQALKIDARAAFARKGLERAEQRVELHRQIDHYLDHPQRLSSDEPLANAEHLLASLKAVPVDEPRLAARVKRLSALVHAARQPVSIQLLSDDKTEVVIYHVGRLGHFTRRLLDLRPGTYTAVGSRPGYRDVRAEFRVQSGQPRRVVDIRCKEPV